MHSRHMTALGVMLVAYFGAAMDAKAAYTDTVDLGAIPSNTVSLQLFNGFENTPSASAQYSDAPQAYAFYGGSGPIVNGTYTGTAAGSPTFIYEFSASGNVQLSGQVDGPGANFQTVLLYSGTPSGASSLLATGQFFCACGPEQGGFSYTSLSGGGGPGSYYIKLSDPSYLSWLNPAGLGGAPGDGLFAVKVSPASAPEIDSGSAASALTLLLGTLAVLRARRRALNYCLK